MDLVDEYCNWDLIGCSPSCRRPWRVWRWRAPRVWTCPGCRTRYTREAGAWVEVLSTRQLARLEAELLPPHDCPPT